MDGDTDHLPEYITNSIGMRLRLIPAGEFMMGASPGDSKADDDEKPVHRVEITKPFYIGIFPVTQEQYERVMGENPSDFKGSNRPVESVSWDDAQEFCRKLGQMTGESYRLPTEAEWEYAARVGSATEFHWGDEVDDDYVWYDGNSGDETHPVGQKRPNAWGLYDMSGNVWEWCADWYGANYYRNSPLRDPKGPSFGNARVVRGGSWLHLAWSMRSANRYRFTPDHRNYFVGFRIVRDAN